MEVSGGYKLKTGTPAPAFDLPGVDGKRVSLDALPPAKALVVAWWCNHCPYVQAYESRFVDWAHDAMKRGVQVVAINANDARLYPDDDFASMQRRAQEKGYPFPYLRDEDQSTARAYGGECTPHFQVFDQDRKLVYQGRFDDNKDDPAGVKERYLPDVVEALLQDRPAPMQQTWAIGCSIKWSG